MKQTILFYVNSSGGLGFGAAARLNALTALTLQCDVAVELSDSLTGFPARRLKLQAGNWIAPNLQPTQSFFTKGALQTFLEWSLTEFQGSNISLVFSSHGFAGRRIQNIGMKFSVRSVYSWCWNHLAAPPQILQLPVLRRDADTSTGGLYIGPIRDAISGALNGKSILQVVAFDACAMGTVEVIDALHPFALTIVGSVVDTVDMNWADWLRMINPAVAALTIASSLTDTYRKQTPAIGEDPENRSLSVFDTAMGASLVSAVNDFAAAFDKLLTANQDYCRLLLELKNAVSPGYGSRAIVDIIGIALRMYPNESGLLTLSGDAESLARNIAIYGFSNFRSSIAPNIILVSSTRSLPDDYLDPQLVPFSVGSWGRLQAHFFDKLISC